VIAWTDLEENIYEPARWTDLEENIDEERNRLNIISVGDFATSQTNFSQNKKSPSKKEKGKFFSLLCKMK